MARKYFGFTNLGQFVFAVYSDLYCGTDKCRRMDPYDKDALDTMRTKLAQYSETELLASIKKIGAGPTLISELIAFIKEDL